MNSAVLNWTALAGFYYTVDYKASTSSTWINAGTNLTTGTVTLNNLNASTTYDWRVTVNCNTTVISNYTTAQFGTVNHNGTIKDTKDGFGIKISPNPVMSNAILDYVVPGYGNVRISVVNGKGQEILSLFDATQLRGQHQLILTGELNILPRGCYFLKVQQNQKWYTIKFIKQ